MAGTKTLVSRTAITARALPLRRGGPAIRAPVDTARLIQPALRVGAVNYPAEAQAIDMARRVVANTAAPPAAPAAPYPGPPLRRATRDQPDTDSLTEPPIPADQADFDLPARNDVPTDSLGTADLDEIISGAPADETDPVAEALPARRAPAAVVGREGGTAPACVAARVARPGPGHALPPATRARVAPHFGTDFNDVRLHDQSEDRDAAARIGARAFTHGRDIWLGHGETATDIALMAHELTHVVQQTTGPDSLPSAPVQRDDDAGYFARKAETYARHVPGYNLITVLYGKTLIAGTPVQMSAVNLLGGLFGLVPGGTAIFDKLNETQAIDTAFAWVAARLRKLGITYARITALLGGVLDAALSLSPVQNLTRLFKPLISDVLQFVAEITQKVLEFIIRGALKLAGPYADAVWGVI
jgi:hypothetical protein